MATNIWNGSGNWSSNLGDWSLGAAPTAANDVLIQTGTVTLNTNGVAGTIVIGGALSPTLFIAGAGSLTAANLTNYGNFSVATNFGDGGSAVNISSGTFANYGAATFGNSGLSVSVAVTVGHYGSYGANGALSLVGNATLGTTNQMTLNVLSAAPTVLTGKTYLQGDSLLEFASGGVTTISSGAGLQIDGQQARVSIGAGTTNSALTGLATNLGTLDLHGNWGSSPGGASVSTTTNLFNGGLLHLDANFGDGASQMTIGGTLTNVDDLVLGNTGLSANSTLTVNNLVNQGSINLWGNGTLGTTNQATLNVLAAAPSTWTGKIYIHGDSDVIFSSGGVNSIDAGAEIQLAGQQARISIGAGASNSALSSLSSNYGVFDEEGGASSGPGGASVTTTANFTNYGTFLLDYFGGYGASSFTDTGLFTNEDFVQIGNDFLSANTTLTVSSLANNGEIYVDSQRTGGAGFVQAALMVNAAATSAQTGYLRVAGNGLVDFASGAITSIAYGGELELDSGAASVAIASNGQNSALKTLASNAGTFLLRGNNGFGSGVALTTMTGFNNSNLARIDYYGSDGGDVVTFGGALFNSGELDIGNSNLSANTNVNATSFTNSGSLALQGAYASGGSPIAALNISGAAAGAVAAFTRIGGHATLNYGSGAGLTSIVSTGWLELDGSQANVSIGAGAQNSGLANLAYNGGTLLLRGSSGYGAGGANVTTTGGLVNSGILEVDYYGSDGGSTLTIGGALTNYKTLIIGNSNLTSATTVNAASLVNTGALTLQGGYGVGAPAATLNVTAASPTSANSVMRIGGDAKLDFGSGAGFGGIAAKGFLELDGAQANIAIGAGAQNSGLANLAFNLGTLLLRGNSGFGQGGVALTTGTAFLNSNTAQIDYYGSDGGSAVTFGGALTNQKTMIIGNSNLSAATTVQATTLNNRGSLTLQGNYLGTGPRATLALSGASPNVVSNPIRIGGTATMSFGSGLGVTNIAGGGFFELDGAQAQIVVGAGGPTSGIVNLGINRGTLLLRGNSGFGQGGVTLSTAGFYVNLGTTQIDYYGGDGGSNVAFNGALNNQGTFTLGNTNLSAASSVGVKNIFNLFGQINVVGGSAVATLSDNGVFTNYAGVYVGANAQLNATGAFTQYGGATTVNGTLTASAYTQYGGATTVNGALAAATVNDRGNSIVYNSALTASSATTSLTLQNGGVLAFHAGVSSSQTVTFQDASDTLQLFSPGSFNGAVQNFVAGDVIDLMGQAATSVGYASGVLSVFNGASQIASFHLTGGAYTAASFNVVSDNSGGTLLYV